MARWTFPEDYGSIHARRPVYEDARSIKEELGLTWTEFIRRATIEMDANTEG